MEPDFPKIVRFSFLESNALSPMFVTLSGSIIFVKLRHLENAYSPMLVIPSGIVSSVKLRQLENAFAPMLVTPDDILTFCSS